MQIRKITPFGECMCEYTAISAEESSWHVQLGLMLNDVAGMGRGLLFTQCRKVTATRNVSWEISSGQSHNCTDANVSYSLMSIVNIGLQPSKVV